MAEGKKRMRSAMEELDELKDKMSDDAYLMLCEAAKKEYDRLTREEERIAHPEEDDEEDQEEDEDEDDDEEEEEEEDPAYPIVAGHAIVPEGVTEIGDGGFFKCSSLTSVTIPSSVTEIHQNVFVGCSSLPSVDVPPSVSITNSGIPIPTVIHQFRVRT